ncbi:TolC family protein [Dryocola clanedunensis]|uniref:TolC family protein n=1 Tax=Cedecea sulfonylureivorans TaxID=3051154 RepID=UPI001927AE7E|nr:TolC family protein [Cedecea sulfonylureivorans]
MLNDKKNQITIMLLAIGLSGISYPVYAGKFFSDNRPQTNKSAFFSSGQASDTASETTASSTLSGAKLAPPAPTSSFFKPDNQPRVSDEHDRQQAMTSTFELDSPQKTATGRSANSIMLKHYIAKMVKAAKAYTPQLREADANAQAAEADVDEAKGQRLPQVSVGLQSQPAQFGSGERVPDDEQTNGLSVNMTTPVYDWGYNSETIESKNYSAKAAHNNFSAQYEDTSYKVCSQLAELAKQKLIYSISVEFVDRMQRLVTMVQEISEVDSGRVSELTQARAKLLQALATKDSTAAKIRDAEIALNKLTGYSSFKDLPTEENWGFKPASTKALLKEVGNHPTIRQARNEAMAAYNQASAVKSSNLPQLNWVVQKTIPINNSAYEQSWQTYLNVSWKLFQGGSGNAQEKAAAARAEAAKHKVEEQELLLTNNIMAAVHDSETMLSQAEQYHQLAQETNQVRKDFFEQWRQLNKRTLLDVLTAESDYYNNQVNEVTTRFNGYDQIFNSYANSGELTSWLGL